MYILITYDVNTTTAEGQRRLRNVAKCCLNHGQRVQNSVFECMLSESQFIRFKSMLSNYIDKETDSIRIYTLGKNYRSNIEHIGKETSYDFEGELII